MRENKVRQEAETWSGFAQDKTRPSPSQSEALAKAEARVDFSYNRMHGLSYNVILSF